MNTDVFGASEHEATSGRVDATTQLPVGSCIQNKYVVHGVLGLGGFAVVYDAEHIGLGRAVAIKVLHLAADTPLALLERFRREARISALAKHRNVLEVYDTGTLPDGSPFLVMERVNGETLSRVFERGPLSLAAAIEIARQLLAGLCALSDAGVVHRDIKPDNLMLHDPGDGEPVLKLVDFGISKRIAIEAQAKLTCQGTLVGTPQYMSPEQIRGQEVDARTDLYATAAVLYEALSGHAPHESQNFSELVVAVLNAPLRPLRDLRANCPAELERITMKGLARSAEQRYASPRAMLDELDACARELELPRGRAAFELEDPIDPIWMTPARISMPMLHRWWTRSTSDLSRPLRLAASVLLIAAPGAAFQFYRADGSAPVAAVASAVLRGAGNPMAPLPEGREPPANWSAPETQPAQSPRPTESVATERPKIDARANADAVHTDIDARPPQSVRERALQQHLKRTPKEEPAAEVASPEPVQPQPVDPQRRARWERAMDQALASMVRGQLEVARSHYHSATLLDAAEPDAFRGLALVCARLGQPQDAQAALNRYLALVPDAPDAASLRARVQTL